MPRFPVWQHSDWRVIDNGLDSEHNDLMELIERIHTTTNELGFAVFQRLYAYSCARLAQPHLHRGTRDMKRAYRQIARLMSQSRFHIICAWVPGVGWRFAELRGLALGLSICVHADGDSAFTAALNSFSPDIKNGDCGSQLDSLFN